MRNNRTAQLFTILLIFFLSTAVLQAEETQPPGGEETGKPEISIGGDLEKSVRDHAGELSANLTRQARSLFERTPLGWDMTTLFDLYKWALELPLKIPDFVQKIMEQSRVLGVAGSLIVIIFVVAVIYSLMGRKRVLIAIERVAQPFERKLPPTLFPYYLSLLKVIVAALIPLLLLGAYALINALISYQAAWFQLAGRLLGLWAIGALITGVLHETLTQNLFPRTARYGKRIFVLTRLVLFYVLASFAVIWGVQAFQIRPDIAALLKFVISVSIVVVLFLLHLMKKALLSLLPDLPYGSYRAFIRLLDRFYYPFIVFSFLLALLWCVGYRQLGRVVLLKTWYTAAAYMVIMWLYHVFKGRLERWHAEKDALDENAHLLFRSLKALLMYATVTATAFIILNLLGLLGPLVQLISFPVAKLGPNQITLWVIIKALLILLGFVFTTRLLQAYLDYRVYPSIGVDPGFGYALNISLKYILLLIGFIFSLKAVGLDLRFLLVFAGAAGIGIGLGLQHMAANVISGFTIIFGGKVRKGDWIEVENTLGVVTDIFLAATRIRTRDNIEYLIPNSNLISNTIVNYSLTSPMVRVALPVGVSYNADPRQVEKILLEVSANEPMVAAYQPPVVRFVEYADSAINFELLVWIDVRETPRRKLRSSLYFAIFEELKKAGIEIPFPQRDLHIRSSELEQLR